MCNVSNSKLGVQLRRKTMRHEIESLDSDIFQFKNENKSMFEAVIFL